jgi:dimeric dUTPase (all-alpha-NTP-PPase superfamily)
MITMQLQKLFQMQKALDSYIEGKHQLQDEDLFDRKVLALLVEIGELANETRCFKFWSIKPSSEKDVILEEFVDGIHFILSLGIECGFDEKPFEIKNMHSSHSITEQFIHIYNIVGIFKRSRNLDDFILVFEHYLQLASLLGITYEEMEQAYIQKNEVNYKRQNNNY